MATLPTPHDDNNIWGEKLNTFISVLADPATGYLQSSVAGSGLGISTGALLINVDNSTVEISADTIRIKDGGVIGAKLAAGAIVANLGYTPINKAGDTGIGALSLATNALTAGSVILGTNPASAGAIRLANTGTLAGRNAANSADINMIRVNTNNRLELMSNVELPDAINFVFGITTGTRFGTGTNQKIGFYNATPVIQPTNVTDLRQALIDLGLYATGGASPLNLNGGTLTAAVATLGTTSAASGSIRLSNAAWIAGRNAANSADINMIRTNSSNQVEVGADLAITDAKNIVLAATTGTKFGTATTQKLGFWNTTPVVQSAAYTITGASVSRSLTKPTYTATNVTTDRTYDANATTVDELADALGTLISDFLAFQDYVMTFMNDIKLIGLVG